MDSVCRLIRDKIQELLKEKSYILVAIDGRSAAGKTTLANQLKEELGCTVIHMDDFFLRPEQRTAQRLEEPGGNVDYERFLEEVLLPLRAGKSFSYAPFDCHTQGFKSPIHVEPDQITVVEGSYSCHPALRDYYDLRIFLSLDPEEQARRILLRNPDRSRMFLERWIPLEEKYFTCCDTRECCQLLFDNSRPVEK